MSTSRVAESTGFGRIGELLRRALTAIREDVPAAYARMVEEAPSSIALEIEGEPLLLSRSSGTMEVASGDGTGRVEVRSSLASLFALLDGETTVLEALTSGALFVRGDVEELLKAQGALTRFLQGTVRTPRMPPLLEEARRGQSAPTQDTPNDREAA